VYSFFWHNRQKWLVKSSERQNRRCFQQGNHYYDYDCTKNMIKKTALLAAVFLLSGGVLETTSSDSNAMNVA